MSVRALALVLSLAGSAAAQRSTIELRVVDDTGAAVVTGRAGIAALDRYVGIENGVAKILDVPAGKWMVSILAIGFAPESMVVVAPVTERLRVVNMHRIPHALNPVVVVSSHDSSVLREVETRMRTASGTLITADNLSVRNATYATDALRIARGFTWLSPTKVRTRGTSAMGGGSASCQSLASVDSVVRRRGNGTIPKVVVVYLDGAKLPGGLESINRMVPAADILAIEAYPDVLSAPFMWRTNDACAVIAYWTKRY